MANGELEWSYALGDIIVKPVLVTTSIKQATCIKQACVQFPKQANTIEMYLYEASTCLKQADFDCPFGACLIQVGL